MGLVDDLIAATRPRRLQRLWPVGVGAVPPFDHRYGHDQSRFSPEEYLDYAATSNEVFSAAMLRARLMSSLRLRLYRGDDSAKKAMPGHPASTLLRYVNPHWSAARLARMDELSMCLAGQSFWAVERTNGVPSEIWWMKPTRVTPVPHETQYLRGFVYEPIYGGQPIRFEPDEVIWFRYPNPLDEFSPLSPLAAARLAADTATSMMRSNNNLFKQGLQLAGVIVPPADKVTFTPEQAEDLADQLERRFAGADKSHRWAVLRYEANFKQMTLSPKDAEFVTGLRMTLRQVCNAYGIPARLLNDPEGSSLAASTEDTKTLWAHTLVPDSTLRADEITEQFLPLFPGRRPDYAEYDYGAVPALQESATETWGRDAQALDRGAITINEWRRRNGLPDVPWGSEPWLPVNKGLWQEDDSLAPVAPAAVAGKTPQQLPDDETNPSVLPAQMTGETVERMVDHHAARRLLASLAIEPRVNGYAHTGQVSA